MYRLSLTFLINYPQNQVLWQKGYHYGRNEHILQSKMFGAYCCTILCTVSIEDYIFVWDMKHFLSCFWNIVFNWVYRINSDAHFSAPFTWTIAMRTPIALRMRRPLHRALPQFANMQPGTKLFRIKEDLDIYATISVIKKLQHNFLKMRGGGGRRPFGIFQKIHPIW